MKIYEFENAGADNTTFAHNKLKEILKTDFDYTLKELTYNKYKKPYLTDTNLYFNISHSKNIVAIVVDTQEVGIDIEFYDRYDIKYINKIFSDKEVEQINDSNNPHKEYSKLWCMKESLLKCIGTGLKVNMKNVLDNKNEFVFKIIDKDSYLISICKRK